MFNCELCLYSTDRSSNLKKHCETKKHILRVHHESQKNNTNVQTDLTVPPMVTPDIKICQQIDNLSNKKLKNDKILHQNVTPTVTFDTKTCHQIDNFVANVTRTVTDNPEYNLNKTKDMKDNELTLEENIKKQYVCSKCLKSYTCRQHLWRHNKQTPNCEPSIERQEIQTLKNQMNIILEKMNLNQQLNNVNVLKTSNDNNIISTIASNNNNSNNMVAKNITNVHGDNVVTNNNQKITVLNYVEQAYPDVRALPMLGPKKAIQLLLNAEQDSDHTIIAFFIYWNKIYQLHEFLGEIILKEYKTKIPGEQKIWVASVQKLSFIVRQSLNDKDIWLKDKQGVVINQRIITPMLEEVKKMLQNCVKDVKEKSHDRNIPFDEFEKLQDEGMESVKIIQKINKKTLHQQILKYIAPHFQLRGTIELIDEDDEEYNNDYLDEIVDDEQKQQCKSVVVVHEKKPTKKKVLAIKNK
jgi:hypothetical protein